MAIFAGLFAFLGRFVSRILTTTLGWASTLLFGQVPQSRQVWLAGLTFGSLVWVALLAGVIVPDIGTFLLGFVPLPDWVDEGLVRLAMLVAVLVLPAILGALTLKLTDPADRPHGRELVMTVARGYLLAPGLAVTLVLLAVVGTIRRLGSLVHRRQEAHVPVIVRPGRYDALVGAIEETLQAEGLVQERRPGASVLIVPARILAKLAGSGVGRLVPDELVELHGPNLIASVYPSDLALSGQRDSIAEARALIARDVRSDNAWFTTTKEAQELEDRMTELGRAKRLDPQALADLDGGLLRLDISPEEWEVLYRRRLQLVDGGATDLAGGKSGERPPAVEPRPAPAGGPSLDVGSLVGLATTVLVALDLLFLATRRATR
jgi:hypothetical protein